MRDRQEKQTTEKLPAAKTKRAKTAAKPQIDATRPVFIDLDDAYGVPFSSRAPAPQEYERP